LIRIKNPVLSASGLQIPTSVSALLYRMLVGICNPDFNNIRFEIWNSSTHRSCSCLTEQKGIRSVREKPYRRSIMKSIIIASW